MSEGWKKAAYSEGVKPDDIDLFCGGEERIVKLTTRLCEGESGKL